MITSVYAVHTRLQGKPCCYLTYAAIICALLLLLFNDVVLAQHVTLRNPSLEGRPAVNAAPDGWQVAINTPDVLPGVNGCYKAARAGETFVGLQAGPVYREGITQQLSSPLQKGKLYSMSLYLAFSEIYGHMHCYGNLAIFGGQTPGDTSELLWMSGSFTDTTWRQWTAEFQPRQTYRYISFYAYPDENCPNNGYGVVVFLDNLTSIRQILKTQLSATTSCKNAATGSMEAKVIGGTPPYSYVWTPGNYRTPRVDGVRAGLYQVQITSADGVTSKGSVTVGESDLTTAAKVSLSDCAGDHKNAILLNISGGMPPYDISMNGIEKTERAFRDLLPGNYTFLVKDGQVCVDTLDIAIHEPAPLAVKVNAAPCSCVETNDGSIAWLVEGGTPPYRYRVNGETWQPDSLIRNLKAGTYHYEIEDANGCGEIGTTTITSPWQNCLVLMPSAFSPNGDGNNDYFRPKVYDAVTNYQLKIFNRWGSLVFQTNDLRSGWDGTLGGVPQASQAFIYMCTFYTSRNELKEYRGTVMLMR